MIIIFYLQRYTSSHDDDSDDDDGHSHFYRIIISYRYRSTPLNCSLFNFITKARANK